MTSENKPHQNSWDAVKVEIRGNITVITISIKKQEGAPWQPNG